MKKLIILAAMALMLVSSSVALADVVICEPQPPNHPSNYWYDVTPVVPISDFHVRTFDGVAANYSNFLMPVGWDAVVDGDGVHFYDLSGTSPLAGNFIFGFDNDNPSIYSHWWTTTNGAVTFVDADIADCSGNHSAEDDGLGYRVHVPQGPNAEDIPTLSQWGLILLGLLLLGAGAMVILRNRKAEELS